ncbi:hypothetical protein RHMOL_Rhmol01G0084600 [Rhododendron molle]|uniref:Uncharacterized protein n=1 Tax=Rhododendron molle TaxID=49168 RepID=A0ACC0Q0S3_RHOML|nr:hypothetical protein RHMOL_Rhmol01G0084600 [Rhododendron molle]
MACDISVGSSSSSSSSAQLVSPNLPPAEADEEEKQNKVCIIIAVANAYRYDKLDWYAFDVSNDPNRNQPRPSGLDLPLPPALSPLYTRIPDHLLPFHHDDVYGPVDQIKPIATRCTDIVRGWAILGTENNKQQQLDMMLFRIRKEKLGNSLECINLGSCSGDGARINGTEWKRVADLPAPVSRSPTCLVLRGKLYCLSGLTQLSRQYTGVKKPWITAYDPSVEKWEPLPDPPHLPRYHPMFTAAIDGGGQLGPCIVVPCDRLLQIYSVDKKCWDLKRFDWDHIFGFPLGGFVSPNSNAGIAVAVKTKLYWYMAYEQCLVGYDLETEQWFQGHLPMHNHEDYLPGPLDSFCDRHSPPSLAHLGCDGAANKFCLSWVSHLPPCPKTEEEIEEEDDCLKEEDDWISRLHCLKVRVVIGDNATPQTGIVHLEVSIISCQSYSVDGTKLFRGAMLVDGNLGYKSSETPPPSMDD